MATSLERLSEIGKKFAQSGTDIQDKSDVAEEVAKGAVKGNINVESASGTVVEKVESVVEEETGQEAGELYNPNNGGNNSSSSSSSSSSSNSSSSSSSNSSSSSSSSSSSNDPPGLVQPPASQRPTQMPTMDVSETVESEPAPVVDNPAMPNEDIDMGITSVESNTSNGGNTSSDSTDSGNNMFGGIDPKIIAGAVAIAVFAMR